MNTIANAQGRIHEVNMNNFIEIKSDLYEQLQGKCLDEKYFGNVSGRVEYATDVTNTSSLKGTFYIVNGVL